jgi:D-alanyl-D-alanine endopeptidase (penicillin-binding protein 7)
MNDRLRRLTTAAMGLVIAAGLVLPAPVEAATSRAKASSQTSKAKTSKAKPLAPKPAAGKAARSKASKSSKASSAKSRRTSAKRARYSNTRRARLARSRAARYARDLREMANPLFRVDETGEMVPDVRAAAAIVYNPVTQEVLWEENGDATRSIASITKVMTALVALDNEFDLTREVTVDPASTRGARHTYLRANDKLRMDDLLHLMLIASDNAAAREVARSSSVGYDAFIDLMNEKAVELGLEHTRYADPSGLDSANVSSARDMAMLIAFASSDQRISSIMRKSEYRVVTDRRAIVVHTTNRLLGSDVQVEGGKTGFIRESGYCLATLLRLPQGEPVAVVVLGARSSAGRFMETRHLFNWISSKATTLLGASAQTPPIPQDQEHQ